MGSRRDESRGRGGSHESLGCPRTVRVADFVVRSVSTFDSKETNSLSRLTGGLTVPPAGTRGKAARGVFGATRGFPQRRRNQAPWIRKRTSLTRLPFERSWFTETVAALRAFLPRKRTVALVFERSFGQPKFPFEAKGAGPRSCSVWRTDREFPRTTAWRQKGSGVSNGSSSPPRRGGSNYAGCSVTGCSLRHVRPGSWLEEYLRQAHVECGANRSYEGPSVPNSLGWRRPRTYERAT